MTFLETCLSLNVFITVVEEVSIVLTCYIFWIVPIIYMKKVDWLSKLYSLYATLFRKVYQSFS